MAGGEEKKSCCSETPLKVALGIINVLFFLLGGILVAVGALAMSGTDAIAASSGDILDSIPDLALAAGLNDTKTPKGDLKLDASVLSLEFSIAFLVVGGILVLLSIEGFIGVCSKEMCALWIYVICVSLMLLVQVVCVIGFFAGMVSGPVKGRMTDMLEKNYEGFDVWGSGESTFFNYIMIDLECCGVDGYEDFEKAKKWESEREFDADNGIQVVNLTWPIACCKFDKKFTEFANVSCAKSEDEASSNINKGCWNEVVKFIKGYKTQAIVAIAIVFLFQVTLIVLASVLISLMRKKSSDDEPKDDEPKPSDKPKPSTDNRVAPENKGWADY